MSRHCGAKAWIDGERFVKLVLSLMCVELCYHITIKAFMYCVKGFWGMYVSDVIIHV